MSDAARRTLWVGPTHEGLWIVRDAQGVCGAIFAGREDALHFAKGECEAATPGTSEWRFAPALDFASIFAGPKPR